MKYIFKIKEPPNEDGVVKVGEITLEGDKLATLPNGYFAQWLLCRF